MFWSKNSYTSRFFPILLVTEFRHMPHTHGPPASAVRQAQAISPNRDPGAGCRASWQSVREFDGACAGRGGFQLFECDRLYDLTAGPSRVGSQVASLPQALASPTLLTAAPGTSDSGQRCTTVTLRSWNHGRRQELYRRPGSCARRGR
jgi:hypothetical protein